MYWREEKEVRDRADNVSFHGPGRAHEIAQKYKQPKISSNREYELDKQKLDVLKTVKS